MQVVLEWDQGGAGLYPLSAGGLGVVMMALVSWVDEVSLRGVLGFGRMYASRVGGGRVCARGYRPLFEYRGGNR